MPRSGPFNTHYGRYEAWFNKHWEAYHSELLAIRTLLPWQGLGLEIGVGTGRFAAPLGVKVGVDPSTAMLSYAIKRGILGVYGVGEALPFKDAVFDYGLVVATLCFVDDSTAMLTEARRILKPGSPLVLSFVDRTSTVGQQYLIHQRENVFYRKAKFYSAREVKKLLKDTGFVDQAWGQTLSRPLNDNQSIEPITAGHGQGSFVVVKAIRS